MFEEPPLTSQNKKPIVFGLPKMREKVLDMLGSAYSNNDLDIEEYEKRLAAAHNAKSIDELKNVVYDFPTAKTLFPSIHTARTPVFPRSFRSELTNYEEKSSFINIIGSTKISSLDITEPNIEVVMGIGETMIDLRDIGKKFTHIKIKNHTGVGSLTIKLPANAQLKRNINVLIGEFTQKVRGQGFWNNLFKKISKEVPQISNYNTNPPILVELSGFLAVGEVIVEYEKD